MKRNHAAAGRQRVRFRGCSSSNAKHIKINHICLAYDSVTLYYTNMSTAPVLIVGAGPTGLALALALLQNGITPRIIQKDLQFRVGQKGIGMMVIRVHIRPPF